MRLLNLPGQCSPCVSPFALPTEGEDAAGNAVEIVYGPTGETGEDGDPGAAGAAGVDTYTTTSSAFTMPVADGLAALSVASNELFTVGQPLYIAGIGYFTVTDKTGTTGITVQNTDSIVNIPAGSLVGFGSKVSPAGTPGLDQAANPLKRFAIIGANKSNGTDGGPMAGQTGVQGGSAQIDGLVEIEDEDSIVTISDGKFFYLPVGTWRVSIRVPAYYAGTFQAYLMRCIEEDNESIYFCESPAYTIPCAESFPDLGHTGAEVISAANGHAPLEAAGTDPQRLAWIRTVLEVSNPLQALFVWLRTAAWKASFSEPNRSRAKGVASSIGGAEPELYTVIEIDEL